MILPSLEAVKITIDLLDKYKDGETVEELLKPENDYLSPEDFLQQHFAQNLLSEQLEDVVAEFFFRITKYRKYLAIIIHKFYTSKSSWAKGNPSEFALHLVFVYLLVIELNECSRSMIEELLIALNVQKASSLLLFFRRSDILTKLYEWGCSIWDDEFVKSMLENVLKKPLFGEVYETLCSHMRTTKRRKSRLPITSKRLYNPRKSEKSDSCSEIHVLPPLPPTRIPVFVKATRAPSTTYVRPIEIDQMEETRERHRLQAAKLLEEAQRNAFRCANAEKSENFKKLVEKIEKERFGVPDKKIPFKKIKATAVQCPKKTAAVILREGARLLKLEQEEIKRYEDLANGGFNNDSIAEWEEEIREESFRNYIEYIEKKHLEGLLSYEEALLAKQKCLKKKKEDAVEFRKAKEHWLKQLEEWRNEEGMRIQESFKRQKALEKGAKEAVEQNKEEKHKKALETMEESKSLKERRLKEEEEDLQRKVQIIKEIKALQALGAVRKKQVDLSETSNLGFLCEMSIFELKERLFLLRIELQEELEKRRAENKVKRECRKEIVDSYEELIESHQRTIQEQKKSLESQSEEREKEKKTEIKRSSSTLESLRRKLYEKRKERLKQQISI